MSSCETTDNTITTRSNHGIFSKSEKELRRKAVKLELAPLLGKAFRYVSVNRNGQCEEISEQNVQERRESFRLKQAGRSGEKIDKVPRKKLRKPRQQASVDETSNAEIDCDKSFSRPSWLPASFTVTRVTSTHVSGWVNTEDELAHILSNHSDAFSCKYISWYQGKGLGDSFDSRRIAWKREDIEPDCPFAIDSYLVRHCPYGMKMRRLMEIKESYRELERGDEDWGRSVACHARLKIRRVTLYEDFKLNPEDKTKKTMWEKMACLKEMLHKGEEVTTSSRIYMQLPLPAAHTSHTVIGLESKMTTGMGSEPMNKDIKYSNKPLSPNLLDISLCSSKLDMEEINDSDMSVSDAFRKEEMSVTSSESNIDSGEARQQSFFNCSNEQIDKTSGREEKNNEKFRFEVRPSHKRTHILASCKVDCPARIKVKRVSLYERFRLEEGDNRRKKDDKMMMLKDMINNGRDGLEAMAAIFMQLPLADAHKNHQVSVPMTNSQQGMSNSCLGINSEHPPHQQLDQPSHLSWLPEYFMITSCDAMYVTGWVRTELDYLQVLERHRLAFGCAFLAWSNDKERTFKAEADRRVMWKKDFVEPGCPLTVHHSLVLACAYSDQSKGKSYSSFQQNTADLPCLAPDFGENIIQVASDLLQEGTSLEIQCINADHQYPELQSFMKPDETYIILVDNSQ